MVLAPCYQCKDGTVLNCNNHREALLYIHIHTITVEPREIELKLEHCDIMNHFDKEHSPNKSSLLLKYKVFGPERLSVRSTDVAPL